MERHVGKRDDAFLRDYRDHISPGAEKGYKQLKRGKAQKKKLGADITGYDQRLEKIRIRAKTRKEAGHFGVGRYDDDRPTDPSSKARVRV
jgi:hypothetical protein